MELKYIKAPHRLGLSFEWINSTRCIPLTLYARARIRATTVTAGNCEPLASYKDRGAINGASFKLDKRIKKPDKAMHDEILGKRLWDKWEQLTGLTN
jgi:hypothetical protein